MKIVIPSMDDRGLQAVVSSHFGQAPFFTVIDDQSREVTSVASPGHQGDKTPAQAIAETGAQVVLCGGMGGRAIQILAAAGVAVFMGAQGTVQQALDAHQRGELPAASEEMACRSHPPEKG
jgi:predicted Fe-Mo cluster-binding NifX family protein